MAENPSQFDGNERTRVIARLFAEQHSVLEQCREFCRGESGHRYEINNDKLFHTIVGFSSLARNLQFDDTTFIGQLDMHVAECLAAIVSVPIPLDSTIHESQTPFTTYCLLKDLCSAVAKQVVWLDRYFDQSIFHRYFSDVPQSAKVAIVTWPRTKFSGKRDLDRYDAFMDVSRLFAQERGPNGYQLVTDDNFHDRWLRCDEKLFNLGGSVKDIGKGATFTLTRLDSTPDNKRHFDEVISRGTEVFGTNNTTHP